MLLGWKFRLRVDTVWIREMNIECSIRLCNVIQVGQHVGGVMMRRSRDVVMGDWMQVRMKEVFSRHR